MKLFLSALLAVLGIAILAGRVLLPNDFVHGSAEPWFTILMLLIGFACIRYSWVAYQSRRGKRR